MRTQENAAEVQLQVPNSLLSQKKKKGDQEHRKTLTGCSPKDDFSECRSLLYREIYALSCTKTLG